MLNTITEYLYLLVSELTGYDLGKTQGKSPIVNAKVRFKSLLFQFRILEGVY